MIFNLLFITILVALFVILNYASIRRIRRNFRRVKACQGPQNEIETHIFNPTEEHNNGLSFNTVVQNCEMAVITSSFEKNVFRG